MSMHKSLLPEFLKYLERTRSLKRTLLHLLSKDIATPCQEKPSRHYSQHHRAQKLLPEPNNIKRLMQNDSSCQECNAASTFKILMQAGCGAAQLSSRHLPLGRPEFKTSQDYIARLHLLPPHPTKKKKKSCVIHLINRLKAKLYDYLTEKASDKI